jgi:hypothetical protein
MANHTEAAPQLPPASVDFNVLHDQMRKGADHETALAAAVIEDTVAAPAPGSGEAPPADEGTDALDAMLKADLQDRARRLGIPFEGSASKADLIDLLRAHPGGVPAPAPSPATAA